VDYIIDEWEDRLTKLNTEYSQALTNKMKVAVLYAMLPMEMQDKILDACTVSWDGTNEGDADRTFEEWETAEYEAKEEGHETEAVVQYIGEKGGGKNGGRGFQGHCYLCGVFGHSHMYCPKGKGKGFGKDGYAKGLGKDGGYKGYSKGFGTQGLAHGVLRHGGQHEGLKQERLRGRPGQGGAGR
jgi:hypothetical protein